MMLEQLITGSTIQIKLLRFLVVMAVGLLFTRTIVMPAARFFARKKSDNITTQASIENLAGIVTGFTVFATALQAGAFGGLVTIVGTVAAALTVAIGFGMREEVGSLVSGFFIQIDNPFVKGDYVKVNETEGVVREIDLRTTILKSSGSEKLVMPNRILTANGVKNFTKGKKTKTSVSVKTPVEKAEKAAEILEKEAVKAEKILEKPEPDTIFNKIEDGEIEVELHYWVKNPENVTEVKSNILAEFSKKAEKNKIFGEKEK